MTGRFPNHITTVQPDNSKGQDNLCSDFLPLNATILSEKLNQNQNQKKTSNAAAAQLYDNYFIGKGHLGYETEDHLPINRGFKSHVGFLAGSESYRYGGGSINATSGAHDFWKNTKPGYNIVPTLNYATNYYTSVAVDILERRHSENLVAPFFMYFSVQNVHSPYELPPTWETLSYPKMWDKTYANMLHVLDVATLNLTNVLHRTNEWDNTLILWTSDNGGIGRGNNYPLRGHKHDPWEGGTRATAFLSGGYLLPHMRGKVSKAFIHISDWYPTLCKLSGRTSSMCSDKQYFSKDGLIHDIDGVDVWPMLVGLNTTQPREVTPITETSLIDVGNSTSSRWWKIITLAGQSVYYNPNTAKTTNGTDRCLETRQPDPPQPGRTDPLVSGCPVCNSSAPCLYDVLNDPTEKYNVAKDYPDVVLKLQTQLENFNYYVTGRLTEMELQKNYVKIENVNEHWNGYLGPCYLRK